MLSLGSLGFAAEASPVPAVLESVQHATLAAEQHGVLKVFSVSLGDRVAKGDVVAVIDHADLDSELARKRLRREYLQAQIKNSSRLVQQGLATDDELRKLITEEKIVLADILALKRKVARSSIKAPFHGAVVEKMVQNHEWVQPGQPIVRLISPAKLQLKTTVPTERAVGLDTTASYSVRFPELEIEQVVRVKTVAPEVEVQSNTVVVIWQLLGQKNGLLAGMKGLLDLGSDPSGVAE